MVDDFMRFFILMDHIVPDIEQDFIFFIDVCKIVDSMSFQVPFNIPYFIFAILFFTGSSNLCEDVVGVVVDPLTFSCPSVDEFLKDDVQNIKYPIPIRSLQSQVIIFFFNKIKRLFWGRLDVDDQFIPVELVSSD